MSDNRFEGTPEYSEYFWGLYKNGEGNKVNGNEILIQIQNEDKEIYPELEDYEFVWIALDTNNEFVFCGAE